MEYATEMRDILTCPEFKVFKTYFLENFRPTMNKHSVNKHGVLVVGAGVNGLTTALRLRADGFKVKVISKEFVPKDPMVSVNQKSPSV